MMMLWLAMPPQPGEADIAGLFVTHAPFLLRSVERLAGTGPHVEEIVQDTFVLAHRARVKLATHPQPRGWLFVTASHLVQHHKRATARFVKATQRLHAEGPRSEAPTPDVAHERREHGQRIRACVAQLPMPRRQVFVLFELEGIAGDEIAAILGIPLGSVWTRLKKAREEFERVWRAKEQA